MKEPSGPQGKPFLFSAEIAGRWQPVREGYLSLSRKRGPLDLLLMNSERVFSLTLAFGVSHRTICG